jgi:cytochrome c-type biogenesis protein
VTFLLISVLAGVLTVLAPCILPLLPIVVGASESGARHISRRALVVITSLAVSIIIFTLLLKASTIFITIPPSVWTWFSSIMLAVLGITFLAPALWAKLKFVQLVALRSNKTVGRGYVKNGVAGDVLMGVALGPVFSTCSPTYLYIIATVLPASYIVGLAYLLGFVFGLALALLAIAYFGQQLVNRISSHFTTASKLKQVFGLVLILLSIAILFGWDKQLESKILDSGYGATIDLEESFIKRFAPNY